MWIIQYRKIFFAISAILVVASIALVSIFGLKFGVDFTGGSVLGVNYSNGRPIQVDVEKVVSGFELGAVVVKAAGENGYLIKTPTIDNDKKEEIKSALSFDGTKAISETQFNTVGPTLGNELKTKAVVAFIVLLVVINIFIAFAFRQVSKPVSSWKYGFIAVIALAHDILVTTGFFALFGLLYGTEVDTLFVTAILVVLGYSVNDTIIIMDRIRENLANSEDHAKENNFEEIVGRSLSETMTRSVNTTFATLLSLIALFFIGAEATKVFALALIVGIVSGAYSSIFFAAPLLVSFKNWGKK